MVDINYDEISKEFYLYFEGKRYNLTSKEISNLKEKLNSVEKSSLSFKSNGNQNLL
jgi:hypothetical protein